MKKNKTRSATIRADPAEHLSSLILNTILKIAEDLGYPYQAKPGLGSMTAYPSKA